MKIRPLLEDAFSMYRTLAPLQVGMLKRISNGQFDPLNGNVNEKQEAVLDELVGLGLLDATYAVTDKGERILSISSKVPTSDLKDAKAKQSAYRELAKKERPVPEIEDIDLEDDEDDVGLEVEDDVEDVDMGGTLRAEKKPVRRMDRVKELDGEELEDDDTMSFDDDGDYVWK